MLSVFTPSNSDRFLPEVYASLREQTDKDWHWTVIHNNGGKVFPCDDKRVEQHVLDDAPGYVGALKAEACARAKGDILVELDHDDLLFPTAIADVKAAFEDPSIGFVYSNAVHATQEMEKVERFGDAWGWRYREVNYKGHALDEPISFDANPDALTRIWYAPNHVRAFRRSVYDAAGGYAKAMRVLDDQDLMCRLYEQTAFKHIDKPLYLYRIHGENTWLKHNAEIQQNVYRLHDLYAERVTRAWAKRQGLRLLDLGGRLTKMDGYESVDRVGADVCCDLDGPWPFEDSSVGVIRAFDILEHLRDPIHSMKEAARVLAPGGWLLAQVPSTDGRGAFQDPTHRSFWNENSWLYYTNAKWARYIDTPARFQAARCYTTEKDARQVCWTIAHLINLKDGYRPPGLIEI